MSVRRWKKLAALAKIEVTEGTDSAPTGAANYVQLSNATFTPLAGDQEERALLQPKLGHQGVILTGDYGQLDFSVEIAGAGDAGAAPAYGPLLRACGFAETVTAGTDVQYDLVHDGFESLSMYINPDGVKHVFLGARGNVQLNFTPQRIPHFAFSFKGLLGTITDAALPVVDAAAWVDPVVVNKANTTLALHGWTAIAESLNIDLGNQVAPRLLIGAESMPITDRAVTGTAVVEAKSLATVDWFTIAREATRDDLALVHGLTAGNIVKLDADAVQIGRPTQGQTNNIINYSLPLMLTSLGSEELKITVM